MNIYTGRWPKANTWYRQTLSDVTFYWAPNGVRLKNGRYDGHVYSIYVADSPRKRPHRSRLSLDAKLDAGAWVECTDVPCKVTSAHGS